MSAHECRHCAGTGMEGALGTGTYGLIWAGACSYCGGKGFTHTAPSPKADPFWYLSPVELERVQRENAEAAEYHAAQDDFFHRHEHHAN